MRAHLLSALIIGGVVLYVLGVTTGPQMLQGLGVAFVVAGLLLRVLGWAPFPGQASVEQRSSKSDQVNDSHPLTIALGGVGLIGLGLWHGFGFSFGKASAVWLTLGAVYIAMALWRLRREKGQGTRVSK
jgi:hypothetical protein